jgi:CMP-N,N'-diacetyllegionaminic acid synthase
MRILGLIPARGGSKGVSRKNIKLLCGKPLIQYTIDAAIHCGVLTEVMVSTEDAEITEIAKRLGAKVPFLRPNELANDASPTVDTVIHVLKAYQDIDIHFEAVCLLQPTNPLRSAESIKLGIEKFINSDADSLISVRKVPHEYNPHWTFELENGSSFLRIATGESEIIPRRQELPHTYHRDGAIYLVKSTAVLKQGSLYGEKISFLDMSEEPHVNIDTMEDWGMAEAYLVNKSTKIQPHD